MLLDAARRCQTLTAPPPARPCSRSCGVQRRLPWGYTWDHRSRPRALGCAISNLVGPSGALHAAPANDELPPWQSTSSLPRFSCSRPPQALPGYPKHQSLAHLAMHAMQDLCAILAMPLHLALMRIHPKTGRWPVSFHCQTRTLTPASVVDPSPGLHLLCTVAAQVRQTQQQKPAATNSMVGTSTRTSLRHLRHSMTASNCRHSP